MTRRRRGRPHGRPEYLDRVISAEPTGRALPGGDADRLTAMAPLVEPAGPDWSRYRKCGVCHAESGVPCRTMSGGGPNGALFGGLPRERAHSGRRPKRGAAGDGGAER